MPRLLLPTLFLVLLASAMQCHSTRLARTSPEAIAELARTNPPKQSGSFPDEWIHGGDEANDPAFQVHRYNDDLVILRQSKFETYEAPFLYLIFGTEKILMMDTGANPDSALLPVVEEVIAEWRERTGNRTAELVVAHTHTHFDHVQGDAQLAAYPQLAEPIGRDLSPARYAADRRRSWGQAEPEPTEDGPPPPSGFELYWGFEDFPNDIVSLDLGDRTIDVIGVPGHDQNSVALYDRSTQLLLTGDIVYPGHLFIFSARAWPKFVASIERLVDFAAANPVTAVVGCHIETRATPGEPYAYGTKVQPEEHSLEFPPTILTDILVAARSLGDDPTPTIFDEVVIHPVYKVGIRWNGEDVAEAERQEAEWLERARARRAAEADSE